ncbi:Rrf2 family transcriptional regulator [Hyunsoonleella flava]|uniref:Rrf2 family transcriptional regulator n=2 Tax=Hyunsoonleella flava TaxID=2527939 RepID=A0A4Q9FD87_9FLAO|nr:Rrf2 family transcriptional regulator [Hyunsoonleella flava]
MLSNSSKYAVKAVLFLALHSSEENKIVVKDIAAPINVPLAYIAKLLQELSKENIISSTRGPKGGFYLSDSNKEQPVINILKIIDGEKRLTSCMLSLEKCNEEKPCPLHNILSSSRQTILKSLQEKTINELALDIEKGNSFLPL